MSSFRSSRRADFNILLALIGVVIVGILLIIIGTKIIGYSNATNKEETCRLSFLAAHAAEKASEKVSDLVDFKPNLNCESKDIIIEPKDVRRGLFGKIDDNILKEKIANEMKRCWSMTGSGKLVPFANNEAVCLICSTVTFSDDFINVAKKEKYELKNFRRWLATHPIKPEGKPLYETMIGRPLSLEEIESMSGMTEGYLFEDRHVIYWKNIPFVIKKDSPSLAKSFVYFKNVAELSLESETTSGKKAECMKLLN